MKKMKSIIGLAILSLALTTSAQTNPPTFIKGSMDIRYNSRMNPGKVGVADEYKMNVNISNSAVFSGSIKHLPYISSTFSANQESSLTYDVNCDVINPRNPSQKVNIGRVFGGVIIAPDGTYKYSDGSLKLAVVSRGTAQGFESKFGGYAVGKPLVRQTGWFDSMKQSAVSLTRNVGGKTVALAVTKYDKLTFQSHVLPIGPVLIYPESVLNGSMIYDYNRFVWYFDNLVVTYYFNNKQISDKLSGNMRWIEAPDRKKTGIGYYEVDIRLNEGLSTSESSIFSAPADEASFFTVDPTISGLTGKMTYKDSIVNDKVTASLIEVDLVGNQLTKQQIMNLFKLIFFSAIVPMNAE